MRGREVSRKRRRIIASTHAAPQPHRLNMALLLSLVVPTAAFQASLHSKVVPALATTRAGRPVALAPEDDTYVCDALGSPTWQKTSSGLSFKDLECGGGGFISDGSIVELVYTATVVSTGEVVERTSTSRPLTFVKTATGDKSQPSFLQEAVAGMSVGGSRILNVSPSSVYAGSSEETVQFELELTGLKTGAEAALFQVGGMRNIFRTALLLSFVPDVLKLVGVLPPDGAPPLAEPLARASDALVAVAQHPVVADAANQWAASGLDGLF